MVHSYCSTRSGCLCVPPSIIYKGVAKRRYINATRDMCYMEGESSLNNGPNTYVENCGCLCSHRLVRCNVASRNRIHVAFLQQGTLWTMPALACHIKRSIFHAWDHLTITKHVKSSQQEPHPCRFPAAGSVLEPASLSVP